MVGGPDGGLMAVWAFDLLEDFVQMRLYRVCAAAKLVGDFIVSRAHGDQGENLNLPRCEAGLRGSLDVLVGGGVTSPELKQWVEADYQTLDAASGVDYCLAKRKSP